MKLYRNAIILVVVLGLLIGAYAAIKYFSGKSSGPVTQKEANRLVDLSSVDITEITVDNGSDKLVFRKKDDKWTAVTPQNLKIDNDKVNSVAINFSSVLINEVAEENAADLASYGLDRPTAISAKMKDGKVTTIEVGNKTPTGSGYYAKEPGKNKIYIIDSYTGDKIKVGRNDIRDYTLFYEKPEDITSLGMGRNGKAVFTSRKTDDAEWEITAPITGSANYSAISPMLEAITQTGVLSFEEDNVQDLSKYGLASPAYSFEFETGYSKHKLSLGSYKVKDSEIYAMLDDNNEVFTISLESFTFLDKPIEEIVEVFAYITNIWDVSRITVTMDGKTVNCEVNAVEQGDKKNDTFKVDGRDASFEDENGDQIFRKYYQALIGVTLSKVEPDAIPSGTAEITFEYTLKKAPGKMKVEFIPKDNRYYYVVKNGVYSGIVVDKKKFDEPDGVRAMYKKLMDAIEANK